MSYSDLLAAFALQQGISSAADLVRDHAERYTYLLKTRDRARESISEIVSLTNQPVQGLQVLDIGSGLGSVAIELARAGAAVTAIEPNARWFSLAEENAKNEADILFVKADPVRAVTEQLTGQVFDLVIAYDVLHRVYDLGGLLEPLATTITPGGFLVFRVPNATSPSLVGGAGNSKRYGLPLVPPDYWFAFDASPWGQYHRRWAVYRAMIMGFGCDEPELSVGYADESHERARYRLRTELSQLKKGLKAENFPSQNAYIYARNAVRPFIREVETDIDTLSWDELNFKYRIGNITGMARPRVLR
ncbi:MAG: methyltransferase domain-containing protein [Alphaproteobacteria bacterium]|nr:methyltransferase domain-containing protein [Alphaproteobacteria bacterium]